MGAYIHGVPIIPILRYYTAYFLCRGTDVFLIRINTAANSDATFVLKYEELLIRRSSSYDQILTLNPGRKVDTLTATVRVFEPEGLPVMTASDFVTISPISSTEVLYSYSPPVAEQIDTVYGLARDMRISYDVVHPSSGAGLVIVNNCYFAHFFSPSGFMAIPVDIVFVIDVSGSMSGRKIEQTIEALVKIIGELRSTDRFTMVTFSAEVRVWKDTLVSASEFSQEGIKFAQNLIAGGGTNFNEGLLRGAQILKTHLSSANIPLLVILTDGQPTAGVTGTETIVSNAKAALVNTAISLNCLGFGFSLNFELLEKLAFGNNGIVRRIYEDIDAAEQLEGFFEEISSPILRNIVFSYQEDAIEKVTDTTFPLLFSGSELVTAGQLSCSGAPQAISVQVSGTGVSGPVTFDGVFNAATNSMVGGVAPSTERLSAYLFIQQLLVESKIASNETQRAEIEAKALALALQYNFVTKLTSLIVVVDEPAVNNTGNFSLGEPGAGKGGSEDVISFGGPNSGGPTSGGPNSGGGGFNLGGGGFNSAGKAGVSSVVLLTASLLAVVFLGHFLCN